MYVGIHVRIVTCLMCVSVRVVLEVCVSHGLYVVSIGMRGGRGGGGGGRGKNIGFISKLLFSCAALYILCSPHFSKLRCAFRQKLWRDLRYLVRHRHLELELYRPVDLQYTVQAVLAINIVGVPTIGDISM